MPSTLVIFSKYMQVVGKALIMYFPAYKDRKIKNHILYSINKLSTEPSLPLCNQVCCLAKCTCLKEKVETHFSALLKKLNFGKVKTIHHMSFPAVHVKFRS